MELDKDLERVKDFLNGKKMQYGEKAYKNNNNFIAIENVLSELETWKKIAEKLAEQLQEISNYEYDGEGQYYCEAIYGHCKNTEEPFFLGEECKKCLIDWARKEVDK